MDTGTIPHWIAAPPSVDYPLGDPAQIVQGSGGFDNWMLAAAAIGTATGKSVPVTVDTIEYYNRTAADDGDVANWGNVSLLPSIANGDDLYPPDGLFAGDPPPEEFVDYTDFEYTRSKVYRGCTTWLDVGTLTWKWDTIINRVDFIDIVPEASTGTVSNVTGFAQMADDVRSVINYLHNNEVVVDPDTGEGFFIDPVFMDTCGTQEETVARLNKDADRADLTVTITSAPEDETAETSATFEFEPLVASIWIDPTKLVFHCKLDDGLEEECTSPKEYLDLDPGRDHTFAVYASAGGTAGLTTTYTWTVTSPLEVTITAGPDDPTYDTSAEFEFEAAGEVEGFYCKLDKVVEEGVEEVVAETTCSSPWEYPDPATEPPDPALEPGFVYIFTVFATDGVENGDAVEYTWEVKEPVDLTVTIAEPKPAAQTYATSATFVFDAVAEDAVVFVCELDGVPIDPCVSGTDVLDSGRHSHLHGVCDRWCGGGRSGHLHLDGAVDRRVGWRYDRRNDRWDDRRDADPHAAPCRPTG